MTATRPARCLAWLLLALPMAIPGQGQTALAGPDDAAPRDARVRAEATPCLNLRISPSATSGIVDCLEPGLSLTLFESREGWSRVRLDRGLQGWVATRFLEVPRIAPAEGPTVQEPMTDVTAEAETLALEPMADPDDMVEPQDIAPPEDTALPEDIAAPDTMAELERLRADLAQSRETEARLRRELEDARLPEAELLEELVRLRVIVGDLRLELDEVRRAELRLRDQLAGAMAAELEQSPNEEGLVAVRAPLALETTVPVDTDVVAPVPAADEPAVADELTDLVNGWAGAWSDRRADDYLSYYAREFTPSGYETRMAWETARRDELDNATFIIIRVEALEIGPESPEGEVEVRFTQSYETDAYSDRVTRLLVFAVADGGWKILRDEVLDAVPEP